MTGRVVSIAALLFFSGMCALVYQIAWLRELRLVFGASTTATAAVLAIFMGGLGLGNAVLGRRVDFQRNALRFYAVLEVLITLACALSPWLIDFSRSVYIALGGQMTLGVTGATLVRLLLASVILGVPTFLMGGTLPAAARAATSVEDVNRRGVALLYGINTLGAVFGATIATFLLLEIMGTRSTLWLACAVNLATAAVAYLLSNTWLAPEPEAKRPKQAKPAGKQQPATPSPAAGDDGWNVAGVFPPRFIYAAAAIVGFAFFLMELVWFRMLGPLLGGTTFTFGLILAVALAGIGIGGALFALLFRNARPTPELFALTCGLEALCIAYPYALGDRVALLTYVLKGMSAFGFYGEVLGWTAVAAVVVLPAAIVSGIQFPVLIALVGSGKKDVGKQVGLTFAWNTVGAILGSLAGGFGLLPLLTAPGSWAAVVLLLAALGLATLVLAQRRRHAPRDASFARRASATAVPFLLPATTAVLALACLTAEGPTAVWRHSAIGAGRVELPDRSQNGLREWMHDTRRAIVWQAEGVEISMAISVADGVAVVANGKSDGNAVGDADSFIMPGLVGALLHGQPKKSLVVGLGTGETAGWLAEVASMERVDVVELEPQMDELARRSAAANHNVLEHPKVHLYYNDAREVLLTFPQRYDLIVSQPSNPYRAGVAGLFTREYYAAVKQRMEQGGLFIQWMQAYEIDALTVSTVWATLVSEFPSVEIWQTNPHDMLLVCSLQPVAYPVETLRRRVSQEPYKTALRDIWQTNDLEGVLARYVADARYVRASAEAAGGLLNTDDHNRLEYGSARMLGRKTGFSIARLRQRAVERGAHRPAMAADQVDWERVEDQRLISYLLRDRRLPAYIPLSLDLERRAEALAAYLRGDFAAAIEGWNSQPREPQYPTELGILAHAYAVYGDPRAEPLLDQLEAFNPVDAAALRALLRYQQDDVAGAGEQVRAAFLALRTNPWAKLFEQTFGMAVEIAKQDSAQAQSLYEAIAQPFALHFQEEKRRATQFDLARLLGPETLVAYLEEVEPHVPWTRRFLQTRYEAYQATGHRRLPAAQRDLKAFLASATKKTLLP